MHPPYVLLEKQLGQTPLEAIRAWKKENPAYAALAACYAGRLDPMAEGKLLVLLGDECKKQKRYHGLDKEYAIEVALDLETDTGDVLGMPRAANKETVPDARTIARALSAHTGAHTVPYPAFSSKTVSGKPLFLHALEGTLDTLHIPTHAETVYALRLESSASYSAQEVQARITNMLAHAPRSEEPSKALGADFRQDAIRAAWTELFAACPDRSFMVLKLRVACGSGTYMRTLAARVAASLGTQGLALSIRRTRIGRYRRFPGVGFWTKQFS